MISAFFLPIIVLRASISDSLIFFIVLNALISCTFVFGPIPGMSSNSECSALFERLSLWNVMANLCTSS